jgi:glycosyltransferase involved in cell wall biosynthesis
LEKKIKLIGFKKNPYNHLIKADLYINSSYFEGFPNSVVEAAHVGLPIIASQSHGGINEILSRGKGGAIYKNSQDLKKLIEKFANNPQQFIKKSKITQKKILKFSLKNHVTNFNKMLNDI